MGTFFETQCRTLFYVNIYRSYKLLKTVRFWATLYYKVRGASYYR